MLDQESLRQFIDERSVVLMDGAVGTELERAGYQTKLPLWSAMAAVDCPLLLKQIHDAYVESGADVITANTFRTTEYTLAKTNQKHLASFLTTLSVEIACEASSQADRQVLVAGSIAPLEDCYRPDLVPEAAVIEAAYEDQMQNLLSSPVDFLLAETMINRQEAVCIAKLAQMTGMPFMMSFNPDDSGCILDGTSIQRMVELIAPFDPIALLVNCRPSEALSPALELLSANFAGACGVYGNGPGRPHDQLGWEIELGGESAYRDAVRKWQNLGAKIIGGCCGTTPAMMRLCAEDLGRITP